MTTCACFEDDLRDLRMFLDRRHNKGMMDRIKKYLDLYRLPSDVVHCSIHYCAAGEIR